MSDYQLLPVVELLVTEISRGDSHVSQIGYNQGSLVVVDVDHSTPCPLTHVGRVQETCGLVAKVWDQCLHQLDLLEVGHVGRVLGTGSDDRQGVVHQGLLL